MKPGGTRSGDVSRTVPGSGARRMRVNGTRIVRHERLSGERWRCIERPTATGWLAGARAEGQWDAHRGALRIGQCGGVSADTNEIPAEYAWRKFGVNISRSSAGHHVSANPGAARRRRQGPKPRTSARAGGAQRRGLVRRRAQLDNRGVMAGNQRVRAGVTRPVSWREVRGLVARAPRGFPSPCEWVRRPPRPPRRPLRPTGSRSVPGRDERVLRPNLQGNVGCFISSFAAEAA